MSNINKHHSPNKSNKEMMDYTIKNIISQEPFKEIEPIQSGSDNHIHQTKTCQIRDGKSRSIELSSKDRTNSGDALTGKNDLNCLAERCVHRNIMCGSKVCESRVTKDDLINQGIKSERQRIIKIIDDVYGDLPYYVEDIEKVINIIFKALEDKISEDKT